MPVRFRLPGGQVPQLADAVVVQEAIAGGTDVTADVFAEGGDVIGATYRERWKSTAGLSAEGMIAPVPEDVGQVVREVCRARQWDGLGNIQMMRRPEGGTVVYEINPRTAGSADLTRHAGFDFLGSVLRRVLGLNGDTTFAAEPVLPTVFRRDWSREARCPQFHGPPGPHWPLRAPGPRPDGRPVHSNPAQNKEP